MKNKKIIILAIAILVLLIVIISCFVKNDDSKVPNNGDTEISSGESLRTTYFEEEKTLDTFTFSDIKIVELSADKNLLTATVKNNGTEKVERQVVDFELFKEDGRSIGIVGGTLPEIEAGGTAEIEVSIAAGVMYAADIEVKFPGSGEF